MSGTGCRVIDVPPGRDCRKDSTARRDEYIRSKFNGQNHEELALAFELSKSQIRRIARD